MMSACVKYEIEVANAVASEWLAVGKDEVVYVEDGNNNLYVENTTTGKVLLWCDGQVIAHVDDGRYEDVVALIMFYYTTA